MLKSPQTLVTPRFRGYLALENALKDKEKNLLFGRVFGELSFAELGRLLGMTPKQAEMAYYYIVRKIRKEIAE